MELNNTNFHAIRMAHEGFISALKNFQDQEQSRFSHFNLYPRDFYCALVKRHFRTAWKAYWAMVEDLIDESSTQTYNAYVRDLFGAELHSWEALGFDPVTPLE